MVSRKASSNLNKIASRLPGVVYQYLMRPDGSACFPYASEAIREIYKVSPEEVRDDASKVFSILHPDDLDGVFASIHKSAQNLTPWHHEYRVKFKDDTVRWLQGNAIPERNADGSTLWYGFISDITNNKQIEAALKSKTALLEAQLNSTSSGILVINEDGKRTLINSRIWTSQNSLDI
jgi:PAS domain S-box-containing protein